MDSDVPRSPSYGIYISQLVRFARAFSDIKDFNSRNLQLTSKLLNQGYRYHKLRKSFGKFFKSHKELLLMFGLIQFYDYVTNGISHPKFYGDLVIKFRKIINNNNFHASCRKLVKKLNMLMVKGTYTTYNRNSLLHSTLTGEDEGTP